ncbi:FxsA family protein [Paenibacillus hodogayensis]|uniref:FxsA family protein n=1 Tax=Paenibacillus hodogayensis TaxID=279208 RepID=A0ABV5VW86_9BACL
MIRRLLLLSLVIVPALEIWVIMEIGQRIGGWRTFLLMLLTSILGAYLAKREGKKVWAYAQRDIPAGQPPAPYVLDGVGILIGGVLLLLPGFLTDICGLLLLLPFTRRLFRDRLSAWLQYKLAQGRPFTFFRIR